MKGIKEQLRIRRVSDKAVRLYFEKELTIAEAVEEAIKSQEEDN